MKRPFAHIGFSVAITLIILNLVGFSYLPIIVIGLAVLFAASLVFGKFRKALSVPLCLGGALLGCIIFACTFGASVEPQLKLDGTTCNAEFYIVDLEEKNNNTYVYTVKTKMIDSDGAPQDIKLKIKSNSEINADSYQIIKGRLKFSKTGDSAFNSYGNWVDNLFVKAKLYEFEVTDEYVKSLNKYVLHVRQNVIDKLSTLLNGDSGGLAIALLIGDKSNLSRNAYNDFKLSGVTHIMAVSGLHLAVLSGAFIFILKKLGAKQQLRAIVVIPLIMFYISLAGFSKSVIRAGVIMIVMLIGELFKRKGDSLNSLGLAVLILCFNPFAVTDVGAMLSVLSALSLITLLPVMLNKVYKVKLLTKPIIKQIVTSLCVSVSVMLYNLPVLYLFFGYVSVASLISNILLVPIGSGAMIMSLLLYVTNYIPILSTVIAFITNVFCELMLKITHIMAQMPYAVMPLNDYLYIMLAAAFIVIGIAFITNKKNNVKTCAALCSILILFTAFCPLSLKDNSTKLLICKNNALLVQTNDKVMVTGLNDYEDYITIYDYIFKNNIYFDTIVLADDYEDNKYNIMLSQRLNPRNIVSMGDTQTMYDMPRSNVIEINDNTFYFDDNVCYKLLDSTGSYYNIKLDDFVVSNSKYSKCDIQISKKYVEDCNGYIDLSESNVVYCLNEDNTFTVRRD